ncbi:MAG: cytochrome b/b6 domain-containing protein [Ilumatobacteraceae bacterium]
MSLPAESERPGKLLIRFSCAERYVHRSVAVLMLSCMATAAILYNGFLSAPVGHRRVVKLIHVFSGFALPVPILLGVVSAAYRSDLRRLNRFSPADWRWLRSRNRRDTTIPVGKFNAGQKLNSALSAGAITVLLTTGILMYFPDIARLSWRTGATFVHDWFALGVGLLVLGHIRFAVRDPGSRRGMRSGSVTTSWASTRHAAWVDEIAAAEPNDVAEPVT